MTLEHLIDKFWADLINRSGYHLLEVIFPDYCGDDLDGAINRVFDSSAMKGCTVKRKAQGADVVYILSASAVSDLCQIRRSSMNGSATLHVKKLPDVTPPRDYASGIAETRHKSFRFYMRRFFMLLRNDSLWQKPVTLAGAAESAAPGQAGGNKGLNEDDQLKETLEQLFPNPKTIAKTRKRLFEIVKLKRTFPNLTKEQLANQLGIGVETIKYNLKILRGYDLF